MRVEGAAPSAPRVSDIIPRLVEVFMLVARHLVVRGRVQGVGFRFFTERAAHREGLSGWVRNTADGHVEAHLEGDEAAVTRVETAIRQGPSGARVDEVEVTDVGPSGRHTGFFVRG